MHFFIFTQSNLEIKGRGKENEYNLINLKIKKGSNQRINAGSFYETTLKFAAKKIAVITITI